MIQFSLTGVGQPRVTILINKDIMFDGIIPDGMFFVELPVDLKDKDIVTILGIHKRNGEDGIWDTKVDEHGNIISDKYLIINNISFNGVYMGSKWIKGINHLGNFESNAIYKNGELSFIADEPLLDWIINEKFIKYERLESTDRASSYSGAGRFDYDYIREKIDAIHRLLNDQNSSS